MPSLTFENTALTEIPSGTWHESKAYRIHLLITKDEEGTYSVVALNLPGAGSCGDTEEEAVENAKEAIRGVLESYESSGKDIPWQDSSSAVIPFGAIQKWVIVNARF